MNNTWYHCITLPDGSKTNGWEALSPLWEATRRVRSKIDYTGKRVLDIGSRDGMWSFEAQQLGASTVVATDIGDDHWRSNFNKVNEIFGGKVAGYYNVPVENLYERLDCFWDWNPGLFDIIQHFGVFYHLKDPLRSLEQCRKCLVTGGHMLIETAVFTGHNDYPMALFNSRSEVYKDERTFWAFNRVALIDALEMHGFSVLPREEFVQQSDVIGRITLLAKAV